MFVRATLAVAELLGGPSRTDRSKVIIQKITTPWSSVLGVKCGVDNHNPLEVHSVEWEVSQTGNRMDVNSQDRKNWRKHFGRG